MHALGTHLWSAGIRYIIDAELKAGLLAINSGDDGCGARLWRQAFTDEVSYEGKGPAVGTSSIPNQGLLFFIDHQPASALSWYQHAYESGFTEIDPDLQDPGYYIALVAALDAAKAGRYEDAERSFHKATAMASAPDAAPTDVFFFRGAIANAKGDVVEARRQWSASIASLRLDGLSPRYSALWGLNSAYLWMATASEGRLKCPIHPIRTRLKRAPKADSAGLTFS